MSSIYHLLLHNTSKFSIHGHCRYNFATVTECRTEAVLNIFKVRKSNSLRIGARKGVNKNTFEVQPRHTYKGKLCHLQSSSGSNVFKIIVNITSITCCQQKLNTCRMCMSSCYRSEVDVQVFSDIYKKIKGKQSML